MTGSGVFKATGRCALLCVLLHAHLALAGEWRGIEPGVSRQDDVMRILGKPDKTHRAGGAEILLYSGRSIEGVRQVQIKLDASRVVQQINVFPGYHVDKETIENTYGALCADAPKRAKRSCFTPMVANGGKPYLRHATLGLAVFLAPDGNTVQSIVHLPEEPERREPPPEDTAAASGDPRWSALEESESAGGGTEGETIAFPEDAQSSDSPPAAPSFPEDPLQIGGQFFVQAEGVGILESRTGWRSQPRLPFVTDAYLDGRPSEHVRAMVRTRLLYDPLLPTTNTGEPPLELLLDQLWLGFDIGKAVYFTVGRQHVHWGRSRFWSHADFLSPVVRDPIAVIDQRVGSDLLKVQVPWPALGLNVYALGTVARPGGDAGIQPGAAFRVEWASGATEIGVHAAVQDGSRPRYAIDISSGLGPIDVYSDVSLRREPDRPVWRVGEGGALESYRSEGLLVAASGGLLFPLKIDEQRSLEAGLEAFYQPWGSSDPTLYPLLLEQGAFDPLYVGKLYAMSYLSFTVAQGLTSQSYGVRIIASPLDRSFLGRAEADLRLSTLLTVNAFVEVPWGGERGVFRVAGTQSEQMLGRVGIGLRTDF